MRKFSPIQLLSFAGVSAAVTAFIYLLILRPMLENANPNVGSDGDGTGLPPSVGIVTDSEAMSSRIAFVSNRDGDTEVFSMNPDGSDQVQLTFNNAADMDPEWSPDGSHIAYFSEQDGVRDLFVINADGSNPIQITHTPEAEINTDWSPDGKMLLIEDTNGVSIASSDGSTISPVPNACCGAIWSPDGQYLGFVRKEGDDSGYSVASVSLAGDGIAGWIQPMPDIHNLAWQPDYDGSRIAFAGEGDQGEGIYSVLVGKATVDVPEGSPRVFRLSNAVSVAGLKWSHDANSLAFYSWKNGTAELHVVDSSGANDRLLASISDPWEITWSPDNTRIATVSKEPNGNWAIALVPVDGSGVVIITDPETSNLMPDWSPLIPVIIAAGSTPVASEEPVTAVTPESTQTMETTPALSTTAPDGTATIQALLTQAAQLLTATAYSQQSTATLTLPSEGTATPLSGTIDPYTADLIIDNQSNSPLCTVSVVGMGIAWRPQQMIPPGSSVTLADIPRGSYLITAEDCSYNMKAYSFEFPVSYSQPNVFVIPEDGIYVNVINKSSVPLCGFTISPSISPQPWDINLIPVERPIEVGSSRLIAVVWPETPVDISITLCDGQQVSFNDQLFSVGITPLEVKDH